MDGMEGEGKILKYELVVSDVDGTLVPWSGDLGSSIVTAVARLREAGIRFSLATGRRRKMALPVARAIGIVDPIIAFDGAALFEPDSGKCIQAATMNADLTRPVIEAAARYELMTYIQADPHHSDKVFAATERCCEFLATIYPQIAEDLEVNSYLAGSCLTPIRILVFGDMPQLKLLLADLSTWKGRIGVWTSFPVPVVECYAPGVDKSSGLVTLAGRFGIDIDRVIAVGDDLNDLSMLKTAGLGVAVANARPEVLAIADLVCGDVEDDGVQDLLLSLAAGKLPTTK